MARGGELKKVSDLFAKYRERLRAPQASVIAVFVEVVDDVLGITIPKTGVQYTPGERTLYLKTHATIRQEVLMHKAEILTHLRGRLGTQSAPKDIV